MAEKRLSKETLKDIKETIRYDRVAVAAVSFVIIGAVFYHYVEKLNWLDSFYFTVMTLATVGYGDISPKTAPGKFFTMFYVLIGISIFIALARIVLAGVMLQVNRNRDRERAISFGSDKAE